jgi:hypothetical protein
LACLLCRVHGVGRPEQGSAAPDTSGCEIHDFRVSEERRHAFSEVGVGKYLRLLPGWRTGDERGRADLNLLKACFLDRRTGVDTEFIRTLVDHNAARRGWLILATHDIAADPSPYGCTPEFLEATVQYASRSGALLLPVGEACAKLMASSSPETRLRS